MITTDGSVEEKVSSHNFIGVTEENHKESEDKIACLQASA
jgi:hypothetical protein